LKPSITKTVRLSATLRQLAGAKMIEVDVSGSATAADLLQALRQAYPALGAFVLEADGSLKAGIQLLIDGRHIDFLQGLQSPVVPARDLFLMPPIAGG
jgi:molybdopterin synthase sulfur carrier subunit